MTIHLWVIKQLDSDCSICHNTSRVLYKKMSILPLAAKKKEEKGGGKAKLANLLWTACLSLLLRN